MPGKIVFSLLLLFSCLLSAQEGGPVLFVNTNSHHGEEIGPSKGLSQFAGLAREVGYQVRSGWHWSITPASLEGIDLYILPEYIQGITAQEKITLREYVSQGGSLLVLTWYKDPGNLKNLMSDFGIQFGGTDPYHMAGRLVPGATIKSPRKCSSLYFGYHRTISPLDQKSAQPLTQDALGKPVVVESTSKNLGLGKVVVCGDLSQFISSTYPEGNIQRADNSAFVYNLLWHLQAAQDLQFAKVKLAKTAVDKGETINLKVAAWNRGDIDSKTTQLKIFLCKEKTDIPKTDALILLKKTRVPAIASGKKKILNSKVKISVEETGTYYLLLWFDPENKTKEKNRNNNFFYYKTPITISAESES